MLYVIKRMLLWMLYVIKRMLLWMLDVCISLPSTTTSPPLSAFSALVQYNTSGCTGYYNTQGAATPLQPAVRITALSSHVTLAKKKKKRA